MLDSLASASQFDNLSIWPLCGRISENPPLGWNETDGCPLIRWGNSDYTDLPLSSTFGPRQKASKDYQYDYHRGIDIPTEVGTPVFAIADGVVMIAGNHSSYSDPLVQIRHYRPDYSSCNNVGCYYSNYIHLEKWVVSTNQSVSKGTLIGYTGKGVDGFPHLHFEIRNPLSFDSFSSWQRDAIHPLQVLPYTDPSVPTITFDSVDTSLPDSPVVQVTVTTPRVDVTRIGLVVYDSNYNVVTQPGNTANANGYNVNPSWFDMEDWNFQYSHQDNTLFPWESFGKGGDNECPYYQNHGLNYEANVHIDVHDSSDLHVGLFNGLRIAPATYNSNTTDYSLTLITFNELNGPAQCIEAFVSLATAETTSQHWGNCSKLFSCQLYAVQNNCLNNKSQFFTVNPQTLETKALGEGSPSHDIKSLDAHPDTEVIYAASGNDTDNPGHLYIVNVQTGTLTNLGDTGFADIDEISFRADGTLWAWAKGDGLISIDPKKGPNGTLEFPANVKVDGLTWNNDGTLLYVAQKTNLWVFDGKTVEKACDLSGPTPALEMLPNDILLIGVHGNKNVLKFKLMDLETCMLLQEIDVFTEYNEIEGIAWPAKACAK
jgi:murein DD-endopeptidase MepM/ murein hydrolase activator NlpD